MSPTFSSILKQELNSVYDNPRHCRTAELAGIIMLQGKILCDEEHKLVIAGENKDVIQKASELIKKLFYVKPDIVCKGEGLKKKEYEIVIEDTELFADIKNAVGMKPDNNIGPDVSVLLYKTCCRKAFLRGVFISCGTISDPDRYNHCEFTCRTQYQAENVKKVLAELDCDAKTVRRGRYYVVYIKEADKITDLCGLMGARVSLLELENKHILREMRGSVNRRVNCETANINKTAEAAARQMEDIRLIIDKKGSDYLPENLAQIASLRLEHPEATLTELSEMAGLGRSGVNHRLRKIAEEADNIRNKMI